VRKGKSRKRLDAEVNRLIADWASFFPEDLREFVCPVCLRQTSKEVPSSYPTEAHVIPRSALGGVTSVLCARCNSELGSRVDKWFGEYIFLNQQKSGDPLQTRHRAGHFEVSGVRLGGEIRASAEKGLELFVFEERSSPEALKALASIIHAQSVVHLPEWITKRLPSAELSADRELKVSIPIPMWSHKAEILTGMLVAGYLQWFRLLGYSWVLQAHLDSVRESILSGAYTIDSGAVVSRWQAARTQKAWLGIAQVGAAICPAAGVSDLIALFPPPDAPDVFLLNQPSEGKLEFELLRQFPTDGKGILNGPCALALDDRFFVVPDQFYRMNADYPLVLITRPDWKTYLLKAVSTTAFSNVEATGSAKVIRHAGGLTIPPRETGRRRS
jgi:hypothetical protein